MKRTVLIVDDDASIRDVLSLKFGKIQGIEVHTANSGNKGVALAKSLKPDLMLLDIMLPDIDGDDVYQTLKDDSEFAARTTVIFLSSLIESDQGDGLSENKYGYFMLSKRLSPDKIVNRALSLTSK